MGIISKLFGRGKKRGENGKARLDPAAVAEIRAIFALEDAMVAKAKQSPVFALACDIVETSDRCTKQLDSIIKFPTEYERRWQAIWISFAFAFFFGHMALRTAFGMFGPRGRDKVAELLCPLLIGTTVQSFDSSEEALAQLRSDLQNIAEAWEIEYSRCVELLSDPALQREFTGNSILAAFARNVLELSGYKVPETDEHTDSWAYADFVVAGKIRCRYSSDPHPVDPFAVIRVQRLAISALGALSLSDHIDKIMSE